MTLIGRTDRLLNNAKRFAKGNAMPTPINIEANAPTFGRDMPIAAARPAIVPLLRTRLSKSLSPATLSSFPDDRS